MGNGIINKLKDTIFPENAPDGKTKNATSKQATFSPMMTVGEADSAINHVTEKFVDQQQNFLDKAAALKSPIADNAFPEKTIIDFFTEILKEQPFDAGKLAKQKVAVVLETGKPAAQMSLADYEQAKNRAIFKHAGYGMLTGDELNAALWLIKSKGSITDGNFGLNNLRRMDKESAVMLVDTNQATIEIARRAAQAVLQFQQYQAKRFDAGQEKARSNTNQMFADQARVVWNSAVNIVEGTINTGIDAALSKGGQDPVYNLLPEKAKPHVDFSGVKPDYRSEMMRRDLNGKLDGDGIKAGQFIETGVTILAPLVVGAAIAPEVAPQSLKTLGGIPDVEAVSSISNAGKAIIDTRKFSEYIFKPDATHGKDIIFRKLGYSEKDSAKLAEIWQKQATEKFTKGDYVLGKKNEYGQRIDIEIKLEGVGEAKGKTSYLKSGWMIKEDGTISLNTPFSGFTK